MAISYTSQDYTTGKQILVFPDHYVGVAQTFLKGDTAATDVDGRKIVKAGTIYPSNDAKALGVVLNDVDITDGDGAGSLIIHGFIKTGAIPVIATTAAKNALKNIQFLPLTAPTATMSVVTLEIPVGQAKDTQNTVDVNIEGVHFRDAASDTDNWTITGLTTAKIEVEKILVSNSGAKVTFVLNNTAATAAGSITVLPKAAATTTGDVPTAAATIVTVA